MLFEIPENPIPEGAETGFIETPDKVRLRYAFWWRGDGPTNGTVCLFHGRGECIEKYFESIEELLQRGFAVATMDWRGQGGSSRVLHNRRKGHVRSFAQYDRDLAQFVQEVVLPDCPPPYYALAHSMGGNVVLRSLKTYSWFDRVVCVAPMVGLKRRIVPWPVIRAIAEFARGLGGGGLYVPGGRDLPTECRPFKDNPLTRDIDRYKRNGMILEADPDLATGSPTIGWLVAALRAIEALQAAEFRIEIKIPVLIVQAAYDRVVSNEAIGELSSSLPAGANIFIDGSRHEILMERQLVREQFWAAFDAFVPGTAVPDQALRQSKAFW